MTDLFLNVLNLSFSATFLALALILARFLLKKAPRSMVCALWGLLALRLLFGGIEAPISLLPSTELIPPESLYEQLPELHTGISSIDNAINPGYSESLRPAPGASVNPLQIWLAVFANLWVLGVAAMAAWALLSCHRIRRMTWESIPLEDGVFLCDRILTPFLFGLLRPRIYLPSELDEAHRPHVLAHERAHIRRRDHWWKPLGFLLLAVHWFNPALWLCYILLCRDIELACDERVAKNLSLEERKAYSAALLECSVSRRTIAACPLAFGEVGVKQRIKSILRYKKPAFWMILLTVLLSIVLATGLLTDPAEPENTVSSDQSYLYYFAEHENLAMNVAVPDGWVCGELPATAFGGRFGLRCRPAERKAWMDVTFYDTDDPLYGYPFLKSALTLSDGTTGLIYRSNDPTCWELIVLHTTRGRLHITAPAMTAATNDWTQADYQTALSILETLSFTEDGVSLLTSRATEYESPLGITLRVENVTPGGATLICTQDGTLWDQLITGSAWNLEKLENQIWVRIMPESTVWTTIAYGVNQGGETRWDINWSQIVGTLSPGTYRISKQFTGQRNPPFTLGIDGEAETQTYYAEFTIE